MFASFAAHGIIGALQLAGADGSVQKTVARVCAAFVLAHVIVTVYLTAKTLYARRKAGVGYFKNNELFFARRISGFAVIIPLVMHLFIFTSSNAGSYRLQVFTTGRLISQILMVLTIAVHVITNIKPLMISLGTKSYKKLALDFILVIAVLLLLFSLAFLIYYLRWMAN